MVSWYEVYGTSRSVYLFFVIILSCFSVVLTPTISAGEEADYLTTLIESAREKDLHEDRYWEVFLHYKPSWSGKKSLIDDPAFFLAHDGKTSPASELEATLRGFFQDQKADEEHPRCRFVARYHWLKQKLSIDEKKLPPVSCDAWKEALARVDPRSAVLVFPAAHMNSPSSMFGHTLLRIDSSLESKLVSHAVNYAAVTQETGGFFYAFNGIFGFFRGYYSILPYYEKVNEYNSMDHRDMWEYALNLNEEEVRRMVMHIWELKDVYSYYYFFDENCAYNLLYLLEAARPSLRLTDQFASGVRFWVIPTDTVRAVVESDLVTKVEYRPSQATRIQNFLSLMDAGQQALALGLIEGRISPKAVLEQGLPREDKQKIFDLAAESMQYRFSRKEVTREEYLKKFMALLKARSTLGTAEHTALVPRPVHPEEGHRAGRLSLDAGYRSSSSKSWFTELRWRAAYHDLMDPDEGYVEGSQITFFEISGRYYFKEEKARLQHFLLLDIFSIAPRDRFFKPISWMVNTGLEQKIFSDGEDHPMYRLNLGSGIAYKQEIAGLVSFLVEADLNYSGRFEDNYALGFGPSLNIITPLTGWWKLNIRGRGLFYDLGDEHNTYETALVQNFTVSTNNGIRITASWEKTYGFTRTEVVGGWNYYF